MPSLKKLCGSIVVDFLKSYANLQKRITVIMLKHREPLL